MHGDACTGVHAVIPDTDGRGGGRGGAGRKVGRAAAVLAGLAAVGGLGAVAASLLASSGGSVGDAVGVAVGAGLDLALAAVDRARALAAAARSRFSRPAAYAGGADYMELPDAGDLGLDLSPGDLADAPTPL